MEIHTRSAEEDTIQVLREFSGSVKGLLHCFSGTWELAQKALDLGFNISFSGIVTFKKADELRQVCKKTPLDRLHLETDAPYLAPVPHRGKQNQPAWMVHTAQVVADLHNVRLAELSQKTQNNYKELFDNCQSRLREHDNVSGHEGVGRHDNVSGHKGVGRHDGACGHKG